MAKGGACATIVFWGGGLLIEQCLHATPPQLLHVACTPGNTWHSSARSTDLWLANVPENRHPMGKSPGSGPIAPHAIGMAQNCTQQPPWQIGQHRSRLLSHRITQVLGQEGASCPNGTVCEIRDCFRTSVLNYDDIINAMVVNFQLTTQTYIWVVAREYEAAAGAGVWWYFVVMAIVGYACNFPLTMVIGSTYFFMADAFRCYAKEEEVDDGVGRGVAGEWGDAAGSGGALGATTMWRRNGGLSSRERGDFPTCRNVFHLCRAWHTGFSSEEGGVNRAPKIWGEGGFGKRAQLTGNSGAKGAENFS